MKKTQMLSIMFVFMLTFSIVLALSMNIAVADDDLNGIKDELKDDNERKIILNMEGKTAVFKSVVKDDESRDEMKLILTTDEGLKAHIEFRSKTSEEKTNIMFKVKFLALIEYTDDDANGVYTPSVDTVIQTVDLDSFKDFTYETTTGESGETIHIITATTTDDVFTCQIKAVEGFEDINGSLIVPSEFKVDIIINNFNFSNPSSEIALETRLQGQNRYTIREKTEYEEEGWTEDEAAAESELDDEDLNGYLSWKESYEINSTTETLDVSALFDEPTSIDEQNIYFCYGRGSYIVHDPKIGITGLLIEPEEEEIDWLLITGIIIGIVAAAAIIGIVIYIKRR